jgi:hypothetical protein
MSSGVADFGSGRSLYNNFLYPRLKNIFKNYGAPNNIQETTDLPSLDTMTRELVLNQGLQFVIR